MQPARFRAYAADGAVHNPAHDGDLEDGAAKFTADAPIAYVTFHGGAADEPEVCLGRVDGPFGPGEVSVAPPAAE